MFDTAGLFAPLLGGTIMDFGLGYQAVITTAGVMALLSGCCFMLDRLRLALQERAQHRG